jgi:hypothetical protein
MDSDYNISFTTLDPNRAFPLVVQPQRTESASLIGVMSTARESRRASWSTVRFFFAVSMFRGRLPF